MPDAAEIVGPRVGKPKQLPCGLCQGRHSGWECPKRFAQLHPGRSMPGFNRDGERIATAFENDEPTPATIQQWRHLYNANFFRSGTFPEAWLHQ